MNRVTVDGLTQAEAGAIKLIEAQSVALEARFGSMVRALLHGEIEKIRARARKRVLELQPQVAA